MLRTHHAKPSLDASADLHTKLAGRVRLRVKPYPAIGRQAEALVR